MQALDASWRTGGWVFDALWTGRQTGAEEIDGVDTVQSERRRESWVLRAARAGPRRGLVFDLRRWRDTVSDGAWQVLWSTGPGGCRVTLALSGFAAAHSRAFGLPVGGTAADTRLRGRGTRLACGVQARARGFEVRALGAALATAERGWELQAHAAAVLRWP